MGAIRGVMAGALGLAALQVLVSNERAYGSLGGAFDKLAGAAQWFLSPRFPAIPDRRQTATTMAFTTPGSPVGDAQNALAAAGPLHALGVGGSALAAMVVTTAMTQLGAPYKFDTQGQIDPATGQPSFDCSGLVTWVYQHAAGIDLVPSSFKQAESGSPVAIDPSSVRPGDLVFTRDTEGRVNGHVGIAVDGNSWITAPHTGAVVHVSPIPWGDVTAVRRIVP